MGSRWAGALLACRAALRTLDGAPGVWSAPQISGAALAARGGLPGTFSARGRWVSTDAAEAWDALRSSFTSILADVEDATGIATITINRPEALNALNSTVSRLS